MRAGHCTSGQAAGRPSEGVDRGGEGTALAAEAETLPPDGVLPPGQALPAWRRWPWPRALAGELAVSTRTGHRAGVLLTPTGPPSTNPTSREGAGAALGIWSPPCVPGSWRRGRRAAGLLTLEGDGPVVGREVLRGGPAGLQQQGQQSVGQPHGSGLRVTIERGQGSGWADDVQRERRCLLCRSYSRAGRAGGGPGAGRAGEAGPAVRGPAPRTLLG